MPPTAPTTVPQVQDLNTLINQYKTAYAPEAAQINNEIATNEQSGGAQVSALDAAKTAAFKGISQTANDRGAYFSGFTPDAEAGYVGTKYLPALAQLQTTIASTRAGLLDKTAALNTTANTNALSEQNNEKSSASAYAAAQAAAEQKAQLAAEANQTRLQAAQIGANARITAGGNKTQSPAEQKAAVAQHVAQQLQANIGKDNHVSNETWAGAYQDAMAAGFSPREFWQNFGHYTNGKYGSSYMGYNVR